MIRQGKVPWVTRGSANPWDPRVESESYPSEQCLCVLLEAIFDLLKMIFFMFSILAIEDLVLHGSLLYLDVFLTIIGRHNWMKYSLVIQHSY